MNMTRLRAGAARRVPAGVLVAACSLYTAAGVTSDELLDQVIAGDHRDAVNRARDQYRHPKQTLQFFGLEPGMTVVEIWPGAGWYTEILAPVLRESGTFYGAAFAITDDSSEYIRNIQEKFLDKLAQQPGIYDRVRVTELGPGRTGIAPPGSADLVLTFRNVHNWMYLKFAPEAFRAFYDALKPGGIFGVVEHRAAPGTTVERMIKSGYVSEDQVIELAREAGFELEARSEINANPADTKDYPPRGVWSLPPNFEQCRKMDAGAEQDACMERYRAIGESDRMTLRFRKPAK